MRHYLLMISLALLLAGCGSANPCEQANGGSEKADVIETHGRIENIEQLDRFVEHVQDQKADDVVLIRHTIEGDPIYYKLDFDGSTLDYTLDTTEDAFGDGEVRSFECESIEKTVTDTETSYTVTGCPDPPSRQILTIRYDVSKQDYFAFHLKYGTDGQHEVNTKEMKLIHDLGNGNTAAVADFTFSNEELNQIYKKMVFANYLEEKKLTKQCDGASDQSYEMTVWINQAERHFEWSACDQSEDGKEMTRLAQDIVNILENNETYRSIEVE